MELNNRNHNTDLERKFLFLINPLLHIDMTHVVKILPHVRQRPTYSMWLISWLLMTWRLKDPGHQQQWYLLCWTELIRYPHVKGLRSVRYILAVVNDSTNEQIIQIE